MHMVSPAPLVLIAVQVPSPAFYALMHTGLFYGIQGTLGSVPTFLGCEVEGFETAVLGDLLLSFGRRERGSKRVQASHCVVDVLVHVFLAWQILDVAEVTRIFRCLPSISSAPVVAGGLNSKGVMRSAWL